MRRPNILLKGGVGLFAWMAIVAPIVGLVALALIGISLAFNTWQRSTLGPLQRAAYDGNVEQCERLVKSGIPVDTTDDRGDTALSWTVYSRNADVLRKLLELGADVNHANQRGFTPLMYTATPFRGHNVAGTPEQRNEIAQILIQHGADVNHSMGDGRVRGSGQTTLHFAAKDRNAGLVRMLLDAGADRGAKDTDGWTPLDMAKFPDYAPNDEVIRELEGAVTSTREAGK